MWPHAAHGPQVGHACMYSQCGPYPEDVPDSRWYGHHLAHILDA